MPDSCILLDYMLVTLRKLVERMVVYPENMQRNLQLDERSLLQPDDSFSS
jgi:adenylosuccinate lyase